jgi:hypothetical protein
MAARAFWAQHGYRAGNHRNQAGQDVHSYRREKPRLA